MQSRLMRFICALALLGTATDSLWAQFNRPSRVAGQSQPTYDFEMRDKPWDQVLEWLTDQAGIPIIGGHKPTGTFNFIGSSKKSKYTLAEIIDILNESLPAQGYLLIRRPSSFIIVPSDKPDEIDSSLIPRIDVKDLQVDLPTKEQKLGRTELAQVVFHLRNLKAEEAEKDIDVVLGPFKRIAGVSRGTKLLVSDTVGNLRRAKNLLDEIDGTGGGEFSSISLGTQDGAAMLKIIQANYGITEDDKPANAPFLELDATRNALIVRGTPQQVSEVKKAVRQLSGMGTDEAGDPVGGDRIRVFTIENRSPEAVGQALMDVWQGVRANPIQMVTKSDLLPTLDRHRKKAAPLAKSGDNRVGRRQLSDPREKEVRTDLPGAPDRPVLVAPVLRIATEATSEIKGSLMVGSDDPTALVLVDELVSILMQPGDGKFEVIKLQHANAVDVAERLDELFNGRQESGGGGGGNPFMRMMMGGRGRGRREESSSRRPPSTSRPIRVVADQRTNSLLVKAAPLEMNQILQLLEDVLDNENSDASALAKTYIIGPLQNLSAPEMVDVLSEVFKDYITRDQGGGRGGFPFFGRRGMPQEAPKNKALTLQLSSEEQTNSIVAICQEAIYRQIMEVVTELDRRAAQNNTVVQVYRVDSGVNPELLQQAVEAIMGESTDPRESQRRSDRDMRNEFRRRMMRGILGGGGGGDNRRRGRRGGGRRPDIVRPQSAAPRSGPDFFDPAVKDDPRAVRTVLFDPQRDRRNSEPEIIRTNLVAMQAPGEGPRAPRRELNIQALPDARSLIITGDPEDVKAVMELLKELEELEKGSEVVIRVFPVKNGDAVSVASTLTQLYEQVVVGPSSTSIGDGQADASVSVLPLPRQNSILVAAPDSRMDDIEEIIKKIDLPLTPDIRFKPYKLTRAKAPPIAQTIDRFYSGRYGEAGQNQVRIQADESTNTIFVQASPADHEEITRWIEYLENNLVPAEIKVFQLKKADAQAMKTILDDLFGEPSQGGGGAGRQQQQQNRGGQQGGGFGGFGGGIAQAAGLGGGGGGQAARRRTPEETNRVTLTATIDQRTNSLLIAGAQEDVRLAEIIVLRLDSTDIRERLNRVYRLRNAAALDVSEAIDGFLQRQIDVLASGGEITPFQQIEREVVVVPEPITNSLIISATPRFFEEVLEIVKDIDEEPPQVVIQVLIAQVTLDGSEEFGVELGLQSPVLFDRGVVPANGFFGTGTVNFAAAQAGASLVPQGVTVNNSINPAAVPGFNFNNTGPLANNPVVQPGVVAPQGITNFGLGRASSGTGIGGFVFSAASDSVNLLIRALKTQGKMEVLSRPQIMTLDNQVAFIQVGQTVPFVTNTNINVTGGVNNSVSFRDVGILLEVTPKINPDGNVIMRVDPEVSSLSTSTVNLGNNVFAPIFNVTRASTTVSAMDGQTVAIGGLISKSDTKQERKVPWLGDLPWVGAAFRFRSQTKQKSELLIILTPRVVRSPFDAERIKAEEAGKLNWALGEVEGIHGSIGLDSFAPHDPNCLPDGQPPFMDGHALPIPSDGRIIEEKVIETRPLPPMKRRDTNPKLQMPPVSMEPPRAAPELRLPPTPQISPAGLKNTNPEREPVKLESPKKSPFGVRMN